MAFAPTVSPTADLTEVRGHLTDAARYVTELRARPETERGDTYVDDLRSAADFINLFDTVERGLSAGERATAATHESRGPRSRAGDADLGDFRSAGAQVTEAEGYDEWVRSGMRTPFVHEVRTPDHEQRTLLYLANGNEATSSFAPVGQPIAPRPRQRRMFLRDLLGVENTGLSSIPYIRETSPLANEGGASAVAEGSAKPEVTMQFADADAPVRKIAAWIPVTSEVMADAPTLRAYINTRLAYMLDVREEQQLLKGTGTTPQIEGIYQVTGTQTQAAVAGDVPATVATAIGKVENVDMSADFAVYNPLDYWGAVATRHANQFDNGGNGMAPSSAANMSWGLAELRTRALDQTECIVGSSEAATVFQREGTTIKVGDQHDTYFTSNKVAVLAERRIAFPIWRPDGFVEVTLDLTA